MDEFPDVLSEALRDRRVPELVVRDVDRPVGVHESLEQGNPLFNGSEEIWMRDELVGSRLAEEPEIVELALHGIRTTAYSDRQRSDAAPERFHNRSCSHRNDV